MDLDELLREDKEAAALFDHLPLRAQKIIRRAGSNISSLAALREYIANLIHRDGPFYANAVLDGTNLDPEQKAEWTMEHQV